jgi:hypothetical protein
MGSVSLTVPLTNPPTNAQELRLSKAWSKGRPCNNPRKTALREASWRRKGGLMPLPRITAGRSTGEVTRPRQHMRPEGKGHLRTAHGLSLPCGSVEPSECLDTSGVACPRLAIFWEAAT